MGWLYKVQESAFVPLIFHWTSRLSTLVDKDVRAALALELASLVLIALVRVVLMEVKVVKVLLTSQTRNQSVTV